MTLMKDQCRLDIPFCVLRLVAIDSPLVYYFHLLYRDQRVELCVITSSSNKFIRKQQKRCGTFVTKNKCFPEK